MLISFDESNFKRDESPLEVYYGSVLELEKTSQQFYEELMELARRCKNNEL